MRTENHKRRVELKIPSTENIIETLELAELGKKAQIVFHDLSNHLTTLSLSAGNTKRIQSQLRYVSELLRSHIEHTPDSFFDPVAEISKVIDLFSEKAKMHGIELHLHHAVDSHLFGSVSAFAHIMTNLLSNAIDSFDAEPYATSHTTTPKQHKEITIKLCNTRQHFLLSVSDTGRGIAESIIEKIFEPKFTTKVDGHGIGLWATKEYVEQKFGGNMGVKSSSNGSVFSLKIPKVKVAQEKSTTKKTGNACRFLFFTKAQISFKKPRDFELLSKNLEWLSNQNTV